MKNCLILALCALILDSAYAQTGFVAGHPALAYWKVGHKKELIIALHGGPGVRHTYLRPEFDGLAEGRTLIYYDQRGVGNSEEADTYSWQEQVKDLRRVIRTFTKTDKVVLVGSSWGSTLAMLYAYTYPEDVRGLILSGTVRWEGKNLDSVQYRSYEAAHYPEKRPLRIIKSKLTENRLVVSQDQGSTGSKLILIEKEVDQFAGPQSAEPKISWATAPVLDSLRRLMVPVLLFNGDAKDCFVDWAWRYVNVFPNATLCTIPGACHDPWFSDPKTFADRSVRFINELK